MKTNRRNFLKTVGITSSLAMTGGIAACSEDTAKSDGPIIWDISGKKGKQHFNMCGYAAPKIDILRVGYIGIGNRGLGAVKRMSLLEGVEIKALCDLHMDRVNAAQEYIKSLGMPSAKSYADGSQDLWKELCLQDDIDLIYVATPRILHAEISVFAMENGKHVATEIPAAKTIDECWQLVEVSEKTNKHCCMLENCVYDFWELLILNMTRQGFFGEITHVDAAYIHYQKEINLNKDKEWRIKEFINRNGNLYPTHGLGPACQVLNVNRGDRLDYMVSMSTNDFTMGAEIEKRSQVDDYYKPYVGQWKLGNMNTSIIKTLKGKTIKLQYDIGNQRPYSRVFWVVGTQGIAKKYPFPSRISRGEEWMSEEELNEVKVKYSPKIVKIVGDIAKKVGGHGGMDFLMEWRLVDCLRNGLPIDVDVYDAATWSSIVPLSEWSVANGSSPVRIPDFTRGSFKTNAPIDLDMSLGGGNTTIKKNTQVG